MRYPITYIVIYVCVVACVLQLLVAVGALAIYSAAIVITVVMPDIRMLKMIFVKSIKMTYTM